MTSQEIGRRRFIQATTASAAAFSIPALGACTGNDDGGNGVPTDEVGPTTVQLPTYQRAEVAPPDLPGDETGLPDGYFSYPRPAEAVTDGPPGSGGTVSALLPGGGRFVTVMGDNAWWQNLNERVGVELQIRIPPDDYPAAFTTALAGGDLPDLVHMNPAWVPRIPDVLAAEFEDLTEYLAGDAVRDYPFLANLPTSSWRATVFNNAIYAVPPQQLVGAPTWMMHLDRIGDVGANPKPANADEFFELCVDVTDARVNSYALLQPSFVTRELLAPMFDAPNEWAVDDSGRFTHMYETDQYREVLDYAKRLWDAGTFHPDAFASVPDGLGAFASGRIAFRSDGGIAYEPVLDRDANINIGFLDVPKADGDGIAAKRLRAGNWGLCGIKKQESKDRVRELLRILNYLAAPFGSEEYLYRFYGTEGTHHTWDPDLQAPVLGEKSNEILPMNALAGAPWTLLGAIRPDITEAFYEHQRVTMPQGRSDASVGLHSAKMDSEGAQLFQVLQDVENDIIQGRRALDDWDRAVDDWRHGGGDEIRNQFEAAYDQSQQL